MEHLFQPSNYPKIKFQTGGRQTALLATTTAPAQYDGFGTVTLVTYQEPIRQTVRQVLIQEEHLEWQIRRYLSGMYAAGPVEYPPMPEDG